MKLGSPNFNEEHFPLEPVDKIKLVIEKRFENTTTGYDRIRWAESQGLELAIARATGLRLKANPNLQMEDWAVGGGQWQDRDGVGCVPVFSQRGGQPFVSLFGLDYDFGPLCVWLFSRKSEA